MASASIFLSLPAACSVLICSCMKYGSHVWRGSTHTALLNWVESKAFHLINSPPLTDCLDSLSHLCNVASLSLFYCYFHADCSSKLANCMPLSLLRPHYTRLSNSHPYSVHLSNARVNQYLPFFIPYTGNLWNSLPLSIFLLAYDLNSFKRHFSSKIKPPSPASISLPVFFTGFGSKRDFFSTYFCLGLGQVA